MSESLLAAVPKDIDMGQIYGLTEASALPVVDMVVKEEKLAPRP